MILFTYRFNLNFTGQNKFLKRDINVKEIGIGNDSPFLKEEKESSIFIELNLFNRLNLIYLAFMFLK